MRRVRVAMIGAGRWGRNHVRVLAREPRCELVAIVEPSETSRAAVGDLLPSARWRPLDDVLGDPEIDAVVIATPASSHVRLAHAALAAGKHVLVEKPLATSVSEARGLAEAARAAGRIGMVGHLMVFHPAVRRIRALLASGTLGEPYYLNATRVNLGQVRSDETALWCLGPHDLSVVDYVLGEVPISVTASGRSVIQPGIEDVVFVTLRFASGLMAHLQLSWLHPRKERRLTLVCSQKMVDFDDQAVDKLRICDKGYDRPPEFAQFGEFLTIRDGDVYLPQLPMEEPLRNELQHFLHCIETGATPDTDFESGVRITAVLAAAERSLRAHGTPFVIET